MDTKALSSLTVPLTLYGIILTDAVSIDGVGILSKSKTPLSRSLFTSQAPMEVLTGQEVLGT